MGAEGSEVSAGLPLILSVQTRSPEENRSSSWPPNTLLTSAHSALRGGRPTQLCGRCFCPARIRGLAVHGSAIPSPNGLPECWAH